MSSRGDLITPFRETEALLESNSDLDYDEMLIQHPLPGSNSVPGSLRFLALYEENHQAKINEIFRNSQSLAGIPEQPHTTQAGVE